MPTASSKAVRIRQPKTITPEHKVLLAQARKDTRAVRLYLEALDSSEHHRGIEGSTLEANFIRFAKSYGQRKGIDYSIWRQFGVPARVLKRAGITRTG